MSTIDESVADLIDTAEGFGRGMVSVENVELAQLWLHSLIATALVDARRDGAEQMRAECEDLVRPAEPLGNEDHRISEDHELADAIRALPLPTGKRQAVRLTDAEVKQIGDATLYAGGIYDRVRAIETAVLAANGLGVRRG